MKTPLRSISTRFGFLFQLVLAFTVGIAFLALASSIATSVLTKRTVRDELIEQGRQVTSNLARQSKLALLYHSAENAKEVVNAALEFPDISGVAIYDEQQNILLAEGETESAHNVAEWPLELKLVRETTQSWYFVAPVYTHDADEPASPFVASPRKTEIIGHVHVAMGKQTLQAMGSDILKTNLVVSVVLAGLLLLLLLAITTRLTTPLKQLAKVMKRAEMGEKGMRAKVHGPLEVIEMRQAFNTMMRGIEGREQLLLKARDAALESARAKGEFATNVTHELRTPLSAVLGMLELLHGMGLSMKQREYVNVAQNAGGSLLFLIDDILSFSRMESGRLKRHPVDFSLRQLLDDIVELLVGQTHRKGLDLGYVISDEVPDSLHGEAARIRQILINLVGNAIKFTEQGEIAIDVLMTRAHGSKVVLKFEVKDTGIGIPDEVRPRIFESFLQVDGSTTREYGGAGLGLAISRQLTEFMGGAIGVESELGQGSTFWFAVPLDKAANAPVTETFDTAAVAGLRVLVVDDSDISRRFIAQCMSLWNIHYDTVTSGLEALPALRDAKASGSGYDIAIIDTGMPFMDGDTLLAQINKDPALAETKVILATNQRDPQKDETPRPANVLGCVAKPIRASLLYRLLTESGPKQMRTEALETSSATLFAKLFRGNRILVVEDDRANQKVAIGMLVRLGCHPDTAENGKQALERVIRNSYDLILMDCHMPQMDGYQATREIRALEEKAAHIPIIAMTANVGKEDRDKCTAAGMDDYLSKPLNMGALNVKLEQWLSPVVTESQQSRVTTLDQLGDATLDEEQLRQLREGIGESFPQMIQVYLEDMPADMNSLQKAIAAQDASAIRELGHKIKGASKNVGANRLISIAQQLEDLGAKGLSDGASHLYNMLMSEYETVKFALQPQSNAEQQEQVPMQHDQLRVIVVEDDRGMRWALRNVLSQDGYWVEEVENGAEAVALCERTMPDMLLMDGKMPVMDGFTACARIRELHGGERIPILIVTALDDEKSIEQAFSAGATDYIPKPVNFAVLRQRVARLLDSSEAEKRVRQLAYIDAVTGLPNRSLFKERLEALLDGQQRVDQTHAILFLDLDRFKIANDTLGHDVGDLLLKAVAERIHSCVRAGDTVARLGGDEFTIILENVGSPEIAGRVAKEIRDAISKPFSFMGKQVYVTCSIGISFYPTDGMDSGTLIKQADMAMFQAKERRDTFRFYESGMETTVAQRLELENELRRALERDEFILHYQPQVEIRTGKIVGMEVLIRWQHQELGFVSPGQFIPLAEEIGLIIPIGEWVLRRACAQTKAWRDAGLPEICIAVNISPRQLAESDLERTVQTVLEETGLEPRCLELEITEGAVMKNPKEMLTKLHRLKEIGLLIAIDDFGTGYSSLSYLKHFPFDKLKVDQSFVRNLSTDPDDAAITLTIITMAHSLKLKAIAEGVETEAQLGYLARNGCDEIQGYYFSKPLPVDEATQMLKEDRRLDFQNVQRSEKPTLLLVDDDPIAIELLSQLLHVDNYNILTANHPREGFEHLAVQDVQVIISDQVMPEMDGIEFLARVRGLYPETVRIMLTAHPDLGLVTKAVNEGSIYKFITKPWDNEKLRKQVRDAFTQHERLKREGLSIH